jgi:hypothetical protein
MTERGWKFARNVILKALALLVVFLLVLVALNPLSGLGKLSLYNFIFPGRPRFPFGEDPQISYNLTINNLDAMFASHQVVQPKAADEYRVFLIGDSSVWGILLRPEQTLAGQLNAMDLRACDGRRMVFYNLGYPTLSLDKDLTILKQAMQYQPDQVIWLVTLESFSGINPQASPLITPPASNPNLPPFLNTLLAQRRSVADWYRLQLYGVLWAATGIDQDYPANYMPAARDLADDSTLNGVAQTDLSSKLSFEPFETGFSVLGATPLWLVNEPILISSGANSNIRYNFYYPRWAYDQYRMLMTQETQAQGWHYLDAWDLVPESQFTNSAIHLTPASEGMLAQRLAQELETACP